MPAASQLQPVHFKGLGAQQGKVINPITSRGAAVRVRAGIALRCWAEVVVGGRRLLDALSKGLNVGVGDFD